MAGGGKETPRQRMIGMMYLVLTALLALQVSNAVLEKFVFIDESLQHSVKITRKGSEERIIAIEQQVEKKGNKESDKRVLKKANEVHDLTREILTYMKEVREKIIEVSGGIDEETNKLKGEKDYDKLMSYILPTPGNEGEGKTMQLKLNQYIDDLNALHDSLNVEKFALDAKDMEGYKNNDLHKNKDWAHLNFDHTPTVAAMAIMSEFNVSIAQAEAEALEQLAKDVGAEELRFDKVIAVVSPDSKIVAAGTKYSARMFVAASSTTAKPIMKARGGNIKVVDGEGIVEFMALLPKKAKYDAEGNYKSKWTGSIKMSTPAGDTTLEVTTEYTIAKPVVQIQSASVSALYLNCGNELNIQVPALGSLYDPKFKVKGGEAIQGSKKGLVTIVPSKGKVDIDVYSTGNLLSTEHFKVKKIPKPSIKFYAKGKEIDQKNGVTIAQLPRNIIAKAIPDESFASFLPKDARYKVTHWEVTLARGKRAIKTKRVRSEKVGIADIAQKARSGDRIVIEVKKVKRRNFKNKTEDVKIGIVIAQVPIN